MIFYAAAYRRASELHGEQFQKHGYCLVWTSDLNKQHLLFLFSYVDPLCWMWPVKMKLRFCEVRKLHAPLSSSKQESYRINLLHIMDIGYTRVGHIVLAALRPNKQIDRQTDGHCHCIYLPCSRCLETCNSVIYHKLLVIKHCVLTYCNERHNVLLQCLVVYWCVYNCITVALVGLSVSYLTWSAHNCKSNIRLKHISYGLC